LFLNKTKRHKDRRPWDYLFLASVIYLAYTLFLMMLEIYKVHELFGTLGVYELSIFFQFMYTGLILLAFISQTDLIFNNEVIIIMKKEKEGQKERREIITEPLVKVEISEPNQPFLESAEKKADQLLTEIQQSQQQPSEPKPMQKVKPAQKEIKPKLAKLVSGKKKPKSKKR
jgi:hypothetical protein